MSTSTTGSSPPPPDDDVVYDSAVYQYPADVVSLATIAIWCYLVLHLFVEYGEYIMALKKSRKWGTPERFPVVQKQAKRVFFVTIILAVVVFIGFSIMVSELTEGMDSRAASIVIGLSRLAAGVIFAWLSINVPQMMGVYYSRKKKVSTYKSVREVRFNLSWNLWMEIINMFFLNFFFSCHSERFAVLYGILIGIAGGALLIWMVHTARRNNKFDRKPCSLAWIIILLISSWVSIIFSMLYISDVWFPDRDSNIVFNSVVPALWSLFTIAVHVMCVQMTKRQLDRNKSFRFNSQIFEQDAMPSKILETLETTQKHVTRLKGYVQKETSGSIEEGADKDKDPEGEVQANAEDQKRVSFPPPPSEENGCAREVPLNDVADDDDDDEKETPERRTVFDNADAPSLCDLFLAKLYETYPCCCCCLSKYAQRHVPEPRLSTFKQEKVSWSWKTWVVLKRVLWYALSGLLLYMTIVNIGSTQQQSKARDALGPAWEFLYPENYQTGPMCGWNETTPNADIRTFTSLQAVYDANYTVAHCGACGDCSNWNDLRIQWTTRSELAAISKKWYVGIRNPRICTILL
mmetsp:Transcript_5713/g.13886  ORF Transcript_5713/g.13886 Transcript_5713/m.13886 type:complete len:576 (+) Transcript_5713:184-1911(+)